MEISDGADKVQKILYVISSYSYVAKIIIYKKKLHKFLFNLINSQKKYTNKK